MIPQPSHSHLQSGIAKLRDGFLDRVAERVMALDAILAAADGDTMSAADRKTIAYHAHKTAGVAATFGFADLGARALEVEHEMSTGDPVISWDTARPVVEALLDEMESALDA